MRGYSVGGKILRGEGKSSDTFRLTQQLRIGSYDTSQIYRKSNFYLRKNMSNWNPNSKKETRSTPEWPWYHLCYRPKLFFRHLLLVARIKKTLHCIIYIYFKSYKSEIAFLDTTKSKSVYSQKILSHYHFSHQESLIIWSGIEPRPLW